VYKCLQCRHVYTGKFQKARGRTGMRFGQTSFPVLVALCSIFSARTETLMLIKDYRLLSFDERMCNSHFRIDPPKVCGSTRAGSTAVVAPLELRPLEGALAPLARSPLRPLFLHRPRASARPAWSFPLKIDFRHCSGLQSLFDAKRFRGGCSCRCSY
jgi:hypothetical protein